jgi:hypothetical protein
MDLEPIARAPKSGEFVILFDEVKGAYEVARWSADKDAWIGDEDAPIRSTPSHWTSFDRQAAAATCVKRSEGPRPLYRRLVLGAVVVVTAGLVFGGRPPDVAGFIESGTLLLAEKGRAILAAHDGGHATDLDHIERPAETASIGGMRRGQSEDRTAEPNDAFDRDLARDEAGRRTAALSSTDSGAVAADHGQGHEMAQTRPDHSREEAQTGARAPMSQVNVVDVVPTLPAKSATHETHDLEHAAEVARLKEESAMLRQAKVAAEARLVDQERALQEERESVAVLKQELLRAGEEIALLKTQAPLSEQAVARERERTAAVKRELRAAQKEAQRLRARAQTTRNAARTRDADESDAQVPTNRRADVRAHRPAAGQGLPQYHDPAW